jgi:hypothetical protein
MVPVVSEVAPVPELEADEADGAVVLIGADDSRVRRPMLWCPASMDYSVDHGLNDPARVREVVEKAYDSYKERLADHKPRLRWVDDKRAVIAFSVMGKTIEVDVTIDDRQVRMTGDLPFLFRPFQSKIVGVIGREVEKWIAKAKAGEL